MGYYESNKQQEMISNDSNFLNSKKGKTNPY